MYIAKIAHKVIARNVNELLKHPELSQFSDVVEQFSPAVKIYICIK